MWAYIFPGQGSQFVGMGQEFYKTFPIVKHTFVEASDTLQMDFAKLCFDGPESELKLTENTQPALLTLSTAFARLLEPRTEGKITVAAGHSLGEYSALVASEVLDFSQALNAVRTRGLEMQQAVPAGEGAMLAILKVSTEEVEDICRWVQKETGEVFEPANYNSPGQVVVSGSSRAAQWLQQNYSPEKLGHDKKARFIPLKVSAPFHCSLMKPAQEAMQRVLSEMKFSPPAYPIIQNVTAQPTEDPEILRENLIAQVSSPVKWAQSVIQLKQRASKLIEVGPGQVLTGLVKKIDSDAFESFNIQNLEDFKKLEELF